MSDFVGIILSNKFYMILAACIIGVIVFFVIKKTIKLIIYAVILLVAFLAYIYYADTSVTSTIKPIEKVVKKAEQVIK